MTKALAQTYTTIHTYRVFIARVLYGACAIAILWYGINVFEAISRTIATEHISTQASMIGTTVNDLGAQYIKLSHNASPSELSAYGMSLGQVTAYIPKTASLGSVALSGHEL